MCFVSVVNVKKKKVIYLPYNNVVWKEMTKYTIPPTPFMNGKNRHKNIKKKIISKVGRFDNFSILMHKLYLQLES